jgi:hypothetical protein
MKVSTTKRAEIRSIEKQIVQQLEKEVAARQLAEAVASKLKTELFKNV